VAWTLVFEESYTHFNPLQPEIAGASISPEAVLAPRREIIRLGPMQNFIVGLVRFDCLRSIRHFGPRVTGDELQVTADRRITAVCNTRGHFAGHVLRSRHGRCDAQIAH
jgi:hypothetical protein